jgi:hypothetical protein
MSQKMRLSSSRETSVRSRYFQKNTGRTCDKGKRRVYVKKEVELPYLLCSYKVPNIKTQTAMLWRYLALSCPVAKARGYIVLLSMRKRLAIKARAEYEGLFKKIKKEHPPERVNFSVFSCGPLCISFLQTFLRTVSVLPL